MTKESKCLAFCAAPPPAGRHQTERDQPQGRWMGEGLREGEEGGGGRREERAFKNAVRSPERKFYSSE